VSLHLTIYHDTATAFTISACESYSWAGVTYTESGTYNHSFTTTHGCDSVVTLHLTVNHPVPTSESQTVCDSYVWNGTAYTESGTYTFAHTDDNGCEQVDTLHLTVNHPAHEVFVQEACEWFEWHDTTYFESGTYTFAHIDDNGCEQVDTLRLTIHVPQHISYSEVVCGSYTWNGQTYDQPGTYTYGHLDEHGCEQVDTLHLSYVDTAIAIVCSTGNFCDEGSATLEVVTALDNYSWSTGETGSFITVYESGVYSVTATSGECSAVAQYALPHCDREILMPNAFSPDGDGLNDDFGLPEAFLDEINDYGFQVYVFNRWGELVYASTDKHFRWNGEVKGTVFHGNVYNYTIEYKTNVGTPKRIKGSVTVL
jgi:gliding motility-associated-like protein